MSISISLLEAQKMANDPNMELVDKVHSDYQSVHPPIICKKCNGFMKSANLDDDDLRLTCKECGKSWYTFSSTNTPSFVISSWEPKRSKEKKKKWKKQQKKRKKLEKSTGQNKIHKHQEDRKWYLKKQDVIRGAVDIDSILHIDFPDDTPFIYFLVKNNEIVYIGQTRHLHQRIKTHKNSNKRFDRVWIYEVNEEMTKYDSLSEDGLENDFIARFAPKYNKKVERQYTGLVKIKEIINELNETVIAEYLDEKGSLDLKIKKFGQDLYFDDLNATKLFQKLEPKTKKRVKKKLEKQIAKNWLT